ncbi:MAG: hypothetical protein ACI86S_001304 [Paracoccaceae bacterium]|jgi:uncharacterized protein (DUF488 family)
MKTLYTIGYEGSDVDQLVETLVNVGVEVLADVRELPLSRKKGLSKNGLAAKLADVGISYIHYRRLGDPKPGRDAAKAGNFDRFEHIFLDHLSKSDTQEALRDLLQVADKEITCMLCFERCSKHCHRSYLADNAVARGFTVFDLVADRPKEYLKNGIKIPRYNPRQSLAAAE